MNNFDILRAELARYATPLRDPEPLREIVDAMLVLLSNDTERKRQLAENLRRLRQQWEKLGAG